MSSRRRPLNEESWSFHSIESCRHQNSSSSVSSAADVDVQTAWDNYDLVTVPVPDDRCSLLTSSTESRDSLMSCRSVNGSSRSLTERLLTAAETDGNYQRRTTSRRRTESTDSLMSCFSLDGSSKLIHDSLSTAAVTTGGGIHELRAATDRRHKECHNEYRNSNRRLGSWSSSTSRHVIMSTKSPYESDLDSLPDGGSSGRDLPEHGALQHRHGELRRHDVNQSQQSLHDDESRALTSSAVAAKQRQTASALLRGKLNVGTSADKNCDEYVATSSDDEHHLSSSGIDDQTLVWRTLSPAAAITATLPVRHHSRRSQKPSHNDYNRNVVDSCQSRRKSVDSSRSYTITKNAIDENDNENNDEVQQSRSLEPEMNFASHDGPGSKAMAVVGSPAAAQSREEDLRTAKSLFEFRTNDELRIANEFMEGIWKLCSRRSLYNESNISCIPATSTSFFPIYCSRSNLDLQAESNGGDAAEVPVDDDRMSRLIETTQNGQKSTTSNQHCQNVVDGNKSIQRLNTAELEQNADFIMLFPSERLAEVSKVNAAVKDSGNLKIDIKQSPITVNDIPRNIPNRHNDVTGPEQGGLFAELFNAVYSKCSEESTAASNTLAQKLEAMNAVGGKPQLMPPQCRLADRVYVETVTEGVDSCSRFSGELGQIIDALLAKSNAAGGENLLTDLQIFAGANECTNVNEYLWPHLGASKLLQANNSNVATTLTKMTEDDFKSVGNYLEGNKKANSKEEYETLCKFAPEFSVTPEPLDDFSTTRTMISPPFCVEEPETELHTMPAKVTRPPYGDDKLMIEMNSTQPTNNTNDEMQPTEEDRKRVLRKRKCRGKVKELVDLFETVLPLPLSLPVQFDNNARNINMQSGTATVAVAVGKNQKRDAPTDDQNSWTSTQAYTEQTEQQKMAGTKDTGVVHQTSNVGGKTCLPDAEAAAAVHKTAAKWPVTSRARRRNARRHVGTRLRGTSDTLPVDHDQTLKALNSALDIAGFAKTDDNNSVLSHGDGQTPEAVSPLRYVTDDEKKPKCCDMYEMHSATSSLRTARHVPASSGGSLLSPLSDHSTSHHLNAHNFTFYSEQPDLVHQSSSTSGSSPQLPLESMQNCDFAVIPNVSAGINDDVDMCRVQDRPGASESKKRTNTQIAYNVVPMSTAGLSCHGTSVPCPSAGAGHGHPPLTTSTRSRWDSAPLLRYVETPLADKQATNDHDELSAQAWCISGGPRLVEVQSWLATENDLCAIIDHRKSMKQLAEQAIIEFEANGATLYPVLRTTAVTVHRPNNVDAISRLITEECGNDGAVTLSSRNRTKFRRQRTREHPCFSDVQGLNHKNVPANTKKMAGDGSRKVGGPSVRADMTTRSITEDDKLDIAASSSFGCHTYDDVPEASDTHYGHSHHSNELKRVGKAGKLTIRHAMSNVAAYNSPSASNGSSVIHSAPNDDRPSNRTAASKPRHDEPSVLARCGLVTDEPIQSAGSVTIVHSRHRSILNQQCALASVKDPCHGNRTSNQTTSSCKQLARQFLLTSLLEHRRDAQRKRTGHINL